MGSCKFDIDTFSYNIDSTLEAFGMPLPKDVLGTAFYTSSAVIFVAEALQANKAVTLGQITKLGATRAGAISAAAWAAVVLYSVSIATNRAVRCDKRTLEDIAKEIGFNAYDWIADGIEKAGL